MSSPKKDSNATIVLASVDINERASSLANDDKSESKARKNYHSTSLNIGQNLYNLENKPFIIKMKKSIKRGLYKLNSIGPEPWKRLNGLSKLVISVVSIVVLWLLVGAFSKSENRNDFIPTYLTSPPKSEEIVNRELYHVQRINAEPSIHSKKFFYFNCLLDMREFQQRPSFDIVLASDEIRRFYYCYLSNNAYIQLYQKKNYFALKTNYPLAEKNLFPWFNHQITIDKGVTKYMSFKSLRENYSGKGIVITCTKADNVEHLAGLIAVLNKLEVKLPIEIMHRGNLQPYMKTLRELGTSLDIRFVNLNKFIVPEWNVKIQWYANKMLSLLVSSFDDTIFISASSVPLVNPEVLFEDPNYSLKGLYMFRDKLFEIPVGDKLSVGQILPPNANDENSVLFNILRNHDKIPRFSSDRKDYIKAGMFAIKKSTHFAGLLFSTSISTWPFFQGRITEDEYVWIGQIMMGNEELGLSKYHGVSVGTPSLVEYINEKDDTSYVAYRVCGTHTGYLSSNGLNLLWLDAPPIKCKCADFKVGEDIGGDWEFEPTAILGVDVKNSQNSKWLRDSSCDNKGMCAIYREDYLLSNKRDLRKEETTKIATISRLYRNALLKIRPLAEEQTKH